MSDLRCMPLVKVTDGPLLLAPPGTLSDLTNMELTPEGYAEARGGFEELMPDGGTGADAISSGGYSCVHQVSSSYGWVRTYDSAAASGSQYSKNLQFDPGGWNPFPTAVVDDACYFGSDAPFSRIRLIGAVAGSWTSSTEAYEYWDGSAWSALTTQETITFPDPGFSNGYASWTIPTDWAPTSVGDSGTGNVYKYWMRVRLSAISGLSDNPEVTHAIIYGSGMREVYALTMDPQTGATSGTLKRQGQSGTTEQWFGVSTSLYSATTNPHRAASYRGRLYFVNGKEQKRWDGANLKDIGLPKLDTSAVTVSPVAGSGTGLGAGIWRYYCAWGYGRTTRNVGSGVAHPWYDPSSYGEGQAAYIDEITTTAGTEIVTITTTGTMPADACALYIYRTQDLTNVPDGNRPDFPAFLVDVQYRVNDSGSCATDLETGGVYPDSYPSPAFPQTEAIKYDNLPPLNMKYVAVYQNRLWLGDDEYWFWSDAFKPDSFNRAVNYITLAKASGGRHTGGMEFGDQMVLWTEDQTWGVTNVDLDVPQLFPIALDVGCIAPDAAAVAGGLLIWPSKDGFYAWAGGSTPPVRISDDFRQTFGKMSYETHGGSKAVGHHHRYDVRLADSTLSTPGAAYRYNTRSGRWSTISPTGFTSTLFPVGVIHAPLGNDDAGYLHPVWGKADFTTSAVNYTLYLGELTTQDDGTDYTCSGTMHFPLAPGDLLSPTRVAAYYQAADGWGTPALSFATTDVIGSSVGTLTAGTADTGDDYSVIGGTFSQVGRGTSDIQITFSVSSAASGTVGRQRLFGAVLQGKVSKIRRGGI